MLAREIVFFIVAIVIYRVFLWDSARAFCTSSGRWREEDLSIVHLLIEIFLFHGGIVIYLFTFSGGEEGDIFFERGISIRRGEYFLFSFFKYRKGINWHGLDKWRWNSNWIGLDFCNVGQWYQLFVLKNINISWISNFNLDLVNFYPLQVWMDLRPLWYRVKYLNMR